MLLRALPTASGPALATHVAPHAGAHTPCGPPWLACLHTAERPRNCRRTTRQKFLTCLPEKSHPVERSNIHKKTTCSHSLRLTLLFTMLIISPLNSNATPRPAPTQNASRTHELAISPLQQSLLVQGPNILKNTTRVLSLHLVNLTNLILLPHSISNPLPSNESDRNRNLQADQLRNARPWLSWHSYMRLHIHGSNARTMPKGNPTAPALGEDQTKHLRTPRARSAP